MRSYVAQILVVAFSLLFVVGFSQNSEFNRYYRSDSIKQKNRVKESKSVDKDFPHLNAISEYDRLGREILWYYINGNTKNYTRYIQSKDTLIEVEYSSESNITNAPFRVEKYVYNKTGKVVLYAECDSSSSGDRVEAILVEFYYNRKGDVESCLYYNTENYPFGVNEKFPVIRSFFKLWNVEVYYYNQFSQMILKRQMIGPNDYRSVDSFFYDKQNRLVRQVKFQKEGFVGERKESDISFITSYTYTNSSIIQTEFTQYRDYTGEMQKEDAKSYESVKDKNGLTIRTYFIDDSKKTLSSTYRYTYYE